MRNKYSHYFDGLTTKRKIGYKAFCLRDEAEKKGELKLLREAENEAMKPIYEAERKLAEEGWIW